MHNFNCIWILYVRFELCLKDKIVNFCEENILLKLLLDRTPTDCSQLKRYLGTYSYQNLSLNYEHFCIIAIQSNNKGKAERSTTRKNSAVWKVCRIDRVHSAITCYASLPILHAIKICMVQRFSAPQNCELLICILLTVEQQYISICLASCVQINAQQLFNKAE